MSIHLSRARPRLSYSIRQSALHIPLTMKRSFYVRPFERRDQDQCRDLLLTTSKEFIPAGDEGTADASTFMSHVLNADFADIAAHYVAPPRSTFLVAVDPTDLVVGMVGLRPMSVADPKYYEDSQHPRFPLPWKDASRVLEINRMAVHPTARRSGVASALNDGCVQFTRGCRGEGIHLTTAIGIGSGRDLYTRLGYKEYRVDRMDFAAARGMRKKDDVLREDEKPMQNIPREEIPTVERMHEMRERAGIWHAAHYFLPVEPGTAR